MPPRSPACAFALRAVFAAVVVVGLAASAALAQIEPRPGLTPAPDPARGAEIARRWCATCHVTAADQTQATGEATPFMAIARRNSFDAGLLALFLLDPHPRMPDMSLTRAEAADLAAYIKSLAPH
ncbi:cytochrome c [Rhodoplanes sp.]|uniref:c-type cytochrome n=1 Tax=Rhodoplanes sp. TaxID=1968906 RepID=UPI0025DAF53F|nr:cytochrome c [Rhodoplanes sp.]